MASNCSQSTFAFLIDDKESTQDITDIQEKIGLSNKVIGYMKLTEEGEVS